MAVVKADAYGHGALAVARALERKVWGFAVSLVEEGVELRRGGIEAPIVVLGSFYGYSHRDVIAFRLTPVVADEGDVDKFARAADEMAGRARRRCTSRSTPAWRASACGRSSSTPCSRGSSATPGVELTGLCSHLASADADDAAPTDAQLAAFDEARRRVVAAAGFRCRSCTWPTRRRRSASASRATISIRPGLALYGYSPPSSVAAYTGLLPAMSLKSRIVALRDVPAGEPVSYGGLWRAPIGRRGSRPCP